MFSLDLQTILIIIILGIFLWLFYITIYLYLSLKPYNIINRIMNDLKTHDFTNLMMDIFPVIICFTPLFINIILHIIVHYIYPSELQKTIDVLFPLSFFISIFLIPFSLRYFYGDDKYEEKKYEKKQKNINNEDNYIYERGNIESDYESNYDEGSGDTESSSVQSSFSKADTNSNYVEESVDTESSSVQSSFSKTETNSNIKYENQSEINEKTDVKDIKMIGYKQRKYDKMNVNTEYEYEKKSNTR